MHETFGDLLKALRESYDLTQEEMAFKCAMQASHIGQLERGEKVPTLSTLEKLAVGMDLPMSALVDYQTPKDFPHQFDEITNKIVANVQGLPGKKKEQILKIIRILRED